MNRLRVLHQETWLITGIVALLMISAGPVRAASPAAPQEDLARAFHDASRVYDEQKWQDAAARFEALRQRAGNVPAVCFNLGNAYFKAGQPGKAILNYRRAWYSAPWDPDIQTNFHMALQTAGVPSPEMNRTERWFTVLPLSSWAIVALVSYWGAFLCLAVARFWPGGQASCRNIARVLAVILILGVTGLGTWWRLSRNPEFVILRPDQQALYAPVEEGTPFFALPEGSIVRVIESSGGWVKIRLSGRHGWIVRDAGETISSWQHDSNR